jgi:hypothetical protein
MSLIGYVLGRVFRLFFFHPFLTFASVVVLAVGLVLAGRLLFPATRPVSAAQRVFKELLGLFLHLPVAILVGGAFVFGTALLFPAGSLLPGLLVTLFGSIFWGALLGFLVCQFARHRSARWVGAVGLLYLIVNSAWEINFLEHSAYYRALPGGPFRYEFEQLFTTKCTSSECWEQLFVTMPVLCCIGYSLGAWLSLETREEADGNEKAPVAASASQNSKLP